MWERVEARLALLELIERGRLRRRKAQAEVFDALAAHGWTRATGRRDEIAVVEPRRAELLALSDRVWPGWREARDELAAGGLPPTPEGWRAYMDRRRALAMPVLPARINRRTAASIVGPHSKARLGAGRVLALGRTVAMRDGIVRLRVPLGVTGRSSRGEVDLGALSRVMGEVALAERVLAEGFRIEGEVRGLLLVENLGAWRDVSVPEGCLVAHVPGWDTSTIGHVVEQIDPGVPIAHFGDLDPNGVRIFRHLRRRIAGLTWLVPEFWREYVERHARPCEWPSRLVSSALPEVVRELVERGSWLEQEVIVMDPRLRQAIDAWLSEKRATR